MPRQYHSPHRRRQAAATRQAILAAARDLFAEHGYAATTIAGIARRAGVAVDTVYATVGRKPALLRALVENSDVPGEVPHLAGTAAEKISGYVRVLAETQSQLAPVYVALRDAAGTDPDCAALWTRISQRRTAATREFVADLAATGELRTDRHADELADVAWSMNGPEYWVLLVGERGWTPDRFAGWLTDAWTRMLLNR